MSLDTKMLDRFATLIVDESKWLTPSMAVAVLFVTMLLYRSRCAGVPMRRRIMAAMNLFFGLTIGTMAFGHLSAVTTKLAYGTLLGSPLLLYTIGILLAVPSWRLVRHARRMIPSGEDHGPATVRLNAWLAVTLLALGVHNVPLAIPAVFNIGYHLHARRAVGWAMVSMAVIVNAGLFIGSLIFLASGQSFEQFRGIQ